MDPSQQQDPWQPKLDGTGNVTKEFLHNAHPSDLEWAQFAARYSPILMTWCQKKSLDDLLTFETCCEVLSRVYKYRHTFDKSKSFRAWLRMVCKNAMVDLQQFYSSHKSPSVSHEILEAIVQDEHGFMEHFVQEDVLEVGKNRTRAKVTPIHWHIFESWLDGVEQTELAKQFNMSSGSVANIISKTRKILKEEIARLNAKEN